MDRYLKDSQRLIRYLEMSTEELCDRADEGDPLARMIIRDRFMEEIMSHDDEPRAKDKSV